MIITKNMEVEIEIEINNETPLNDILFQDSIEEKITELLGGDNIYETLEKEYLVNGEFYYVLSVNDISIVTVDSSSIRVGITVDIREE